MAPPELPPQLANRDAVVIPEGERDIATKAAQWESMKTFHRAPCLASSLSAGVLGGVGFGGLRYFTGSDRRAVFTWGCVVGGLLYGTSWFTCRRRMYSEIQAEASMLQGVSRGEPEALAEYKRKLEARSRPP